MICQKPQLARCSGSNCAMVNWQVDQPIFLNIDAVKLETRCWGAPPNEANTIVLLHEGLGCVDLWRDFPEQLAERMSMGVFAYSRQGYGKSDPCQLPRSIDYMTNEAVDVLPKVLDAIGFRQGSLLGHSDGASIAAIHAGKVKDARVKQIVLMAPHFFTEPMGLASIRAASEAYNDGDLKSKLARYHENVDYAFLGWNGAWLDPEFEHWNIEDVLPGIDIPILAIQGEGDQYGTAAQIDVIGEKASGPVKRNILSDCGHSPHIDQIEMVLGLVGAFVGANVVDIYDID